MFKKNDKVKLIRPIGELQKIGEVFRISNIIGHIIVIASEETEKKETISDVGINTYFEKVEEQVDNKSLKGVSYEKIEKLMAEANIYVTTFFDKTTVVAAQFPNGFVITESFSCIDPRAYNMLYGKEICLRRIKERLWEMEGYSLQEQEYLLKKSYDAVSSENKKIEKPKNEVTQEIAKKAYKDLMTIFKKELERDTNPTNLEEVYCKRIEEMSREFNVEQEELAKRITEISTEKICKAFMIDFWDSITLKRRFHEERRYRNT